ncbi:MAG: hypothetical protein WCJ24_02795 [Candidatus Saccharibacteria bacterium]
MFRRQKHNTPKRARQPKSANRELLSYSANQTIRANNQNRQPNQRDAPTYARSAWWQHAWVRNLPSLIALTAITLSVLYCLGLTTSPKVVVSASSPQTVVLRDKSEYQLGAQKILSQSLLSHTKFTVDTSGFEKAFRSEFPEVADVSLTLPLISRRPIVTISTAQPEIILTSSGKAYVLDKRGSVIMSANDLSSGLRTSLPIVDDQSGLSAEFGKIVLPANNILFITSVLQQFRAKQIPVESITLPKFAHEVDFKLSGQPYYIKFSFDTQAREAAGASLAAIQKFVQTNSVPGQYIDVRVPGRAYYQ